MRKHATLALALLLASLPASAAGDAAWTLQSAKTVGDNSTVFWGQGGFPGVWFELVHGTDAVTEIGGKLALNYAQEGITNYCCHFGMDFQFLIRRNFFDNGRIWIAGTFEPGLLLYFPSGATQAGLAFPVGIQFGFPASRLVTLNASFDLAMYALFSANGYAGYFALPILFGGGLEYVVERNLVFTFQLKLGPSILTTAGAPAEFTLYALVGLAYKL